MPHEGKSLILIVDDDENVLKVLEHLLSPHGYHVVTATGALKAMESIKFAKPDLILLDILMPDMDGFQFCSKLQASEDTAYIPVIFISVLGTSESRAKAFNCGCVDYLVKPFNQEDLLHKVDLHLRTNKKFKLLREEEILWDERILPSHFSKFRDYLAEQLNLSVDQQEKLAVVRPEHIYSCAKDIGVSERQLAKYISLFLKVDYLPHINPEDVKLGVLPVPFCKLYSVIPLMDEKPESFIFVLADPFNWELVDMLKKFVGQHLFGGLKITEPRNIESLLSGGAVLVGEKIEGGKEKKASKKKAKTAVSAEQELAEQLKNSNILYISNNILDAAVAERASDIHIEPKEKFSVVRFRVDGDMQDIFTFQNDTAARVIGRLKSLCGMDITERRRPQDGSLEAIIDQRSFKLRLATASTPSGESLVIRVLEPNARPKPLEQLGMTDEQVKTMIDFANRTLGFILIVGPTGSGKTTTIYSLLAQIDTRSRSLISVEDPVEYRIPLANQQQVNEKAGITFETLLKSSVRQDPDILFIGEIRDPYSAKISVDFASTGHMTVTTLHTSNATTAVFRLERLGISRAILADTILGVVAQRLLKKLCPSCKKVEPITEEEKKMLAPFCRDLPEKVAHPAGCPKCNNTGYFGREGVYEILKFDSQISAMIRGETPISDIREFVKQRGDFLISHHAVEKVKKLIISPRDAYEKVLVEEPAPVKLVPSVSHVPPNGEHVPRKPEPVPEQPKNSVPSILIVEDDLDTRNLLKAYLEHKGYDLTFAGDGVEALLKLGSQHFDLILSDIYMPNLDGFKLLEMLPQKGVKTPVIFVTGKTETDTEIKALEMGALDFIRKPIKKEILLLRVRTAISKSAQKQAA